MPASRCRCTGSRSSRARPGFIAEIKAGPTRTSFPDIVADPKIVGRNAHFDLIAGSHRYYLLWITKLGGHFHYARINQVTGSD